MTSKKTYEQGQHSQLIPVELFRVTCQSLLMETLTISLRHALINLTEKQFSFLCPSRGGEKCKQVKGR